MCLGDYGHRLVMDLYPASMAVFEQQVENAIETAGKRAESAKVLAKAAETPTLDAAQTGEKGSAALGDKVGDKVTAKVLDLRTQIKPEKSAKLPARSDNGDYKRLTTIAIDAGHGGEDPGAKGAKGSYEKHITLSIARKPHIADTLQGMTAVLLATLSNTVMKFLIVVFLGDKSLRKWVGLGFGAIFLATVLGMAAMWLL